MAYGWWAETVSVMAAALDGLTASFSGTLADAAVLAGVLHTPSAALTGVMQPQGVLAGSVPQLVASLTGVPLESGVLAAALSAPPAAAFAGTQTDPGVLAAALPSPPAALLSGVQSDAATMAAQMALLTGALTGVEQPSGTMAAALQKITAALSGTQTQPGTLAGLLQKATASITGTVVGTHYISGGTAETKEHTASATTLTETWTETVPSGAALAIVWVAADDSGTGGTHTLTLGGTAMTLTSSAALANSSGFYANLYCFTMLSPPSGSQTFVMTRANSYAIAMQTAYYGGVSSLGTPITATGITAASMSMAATGSTANNVYAQAFSYLASGGGGLSSYSQTQRSSSSLAPDSDGYINPLMFGDGVGNGGTLTFAATQPSGGFGGGGIIIPLNP